ncbi:ArsC family transcriptional regulator [Oceanispirochaeta crateris]|uniref:ArsC family transcriptional regulator n=1 Tax=Oceanispirochaeta crateris TaxID=2518645 RepID=A0A5C1QKM1_9SPIO|nr:ArsC/Spx/MgsR family protein [Oceanispirochaeta crateris]QEN07144.1 ArsC family transcriptional regulator [Oceanispirochaeta crateris]
MNIQIIGKKKCQDTRKAERFFKERGHKYFTLDLNEKALSPGELRNILAKVSSDDLVDKDSKLYKQKFSFMDFDPEEELLAHPDLIKTPIIRCDGKVCVGYKPETWKTWIEG